MFVNLQRYILLAVLVLTFLLSWGQPLTISAEGEADIAYEALVLNALDILSIETYDPAAQMTRGEFAQYVVRMLDLQDMLGSMSAGRVFSDLPDGHTYGPAIALMYEMKLMIGDEDSRVFPDQSITYAQAIKILVSAAGYDVVAQANGGYPEGYLIVGANTRISRNTVGHSDEAIDMETAVRLIYNTMEVDIMSSVGYLEQKYTVTNGTTLLSNKLQRNDMVIQRGIVTANSYTDLEGVDELREDEIHIDGRRYKNGGKNYDALLGYSVEAYIVEDGVGLPVVKSAFKRPLYNEELRVDAEHNMGFRVGKLMYAVDTGNRNKTANISADAIYMYNGRLLSPVTDADLIPVPDFVTLISNDADTNYDVVLMEDSESLVVGGVSRTNGIIHFKKFAGREITFRGRSAIYLNNEDAGYTTSITDVTGMPLTIDDISENDVVTITESRDGKYIHILVTQDSVTGVLQEISEDTILIGETEYSLSKTNENAPLFDVQIGDNARFYLDAYGKVVLCEKLGSEGFTYAYVVDVAPSANSLIQSMQVKLMHKASMEKVVDKNDSTKISYILRNGEMKTLLIKDDVKINGARVNNMSDLQLKGMLIQYHINAQGEIDSIKYPEIYSRPLGYTFNSKLASFGGQLEGGFMMDEKSAVICVPISGNEDDYYQQVKLVNGDSYDVFGYDVDEVTTIAQGVVIVANMSANGSTAINDQSDVAIVKKCGVALDDAGQQVYKVTLLDDDVEKVLYFNDNSSVAAVAANLRVGDLINYTQDAFNRINGIKILAHPGDYNSPTLIREWQTDEIVFGYVSDVKLNSFHSANNEMVDRVTVQYDETGLTKEYILPREEEPPIYVYYPAKKTVGNIESDDFIPNSIAIDHASKIFMTVCEGRVRAVVIIA